MNPDEVTPLSLSNDAESFGSQDAGVVHRTTSQSSGTSALGEPPSGPE